MWYNIYAKVLVKLQPIEKNSPLQQKRGWVGLRMVVELSGLKRFVIAAVMISISTACFAYSPADLNTDGFVDFDDFAVLANQWFTSPNGMPSADIDSTGIVDFTDLALFAAEWGSVMTFTISGMTDGVDGVAMNGLPGSPVTNGDGFYSAVVPYGWSGTVTPTKQGYAFSPQSVSYTNVTSDLSEQNFTATQIVTFTIWGTTGLDGVTMTGLPGDPVTNGDGFYSAVVPYGWSGTVTPTKAGVSFNPVSKSYTNVTADESEQNYSATAITFTISGTADIGGVTMNGLPGDPVTNGGGFYSAVVPYGWSGTVTPTKQDYVFSPQSVSYTNITSDLSELNFTATQIITFTIWGTTGLDGVTMTGLPGDPVTNGDGFYSAVVLYGWSGTVTPTKTGVSFDPVSKSYTNVTADESKQNYSATVLAFTISGTTEIDGVTMSGLPGDPVTDGDGFYSAVVPYGWSGTVTPTKANFSFDPVSKSYTNVTADESGQNYTGTQIAFTISGTTNLSGVTMSGLPGDPVTNGDGFYSAVVPYSWSGTITPMLAGYVFTPPIRSYTYVSTDISSQDYTAAQPISENCVQWRLNDNSDSGIVVGSELNGRIFDGLNNHTSTVAATVNGVPAFHFDGSDDYVRITIPKIWPSALLNRWTKYESNPLSGIKGSNTGVRYGQIVKNPSGGYWWYGCTVNSPAYDVHRFSSTDMITWTDDGVCLAGTQNSADFDQRIHVVTVIRKPDDTWVMFYRGYSTVTGYQIGKAISDDGMIFTRVGNGLFTGLGTYPNIPYDPTGLMYDDGTYYLWVGGLNGATASGHGNQRLFTSTDLDTFTEVTPTPRFTGDKDFDHFCGSPFYYDGWYYFLVTRDFAATTSTAVYNRGIGLYRSTEPTFAPANRDFLGYVIINDGVNNALGSYPNYDIYYLDTPSVAVTDSRRTLSTEFDDKIYCIYDGVSEAKKDFQHLAWGSITDLVTRKPKMNEFVNQKMSISFWVQFDRLNSGDAVFSIGSSPTDSSPVCLCAVRGNGPDKVLAMYLGGNYRLDTTPLSVDTPYQIVVVQQELNQVKMYINGTWDGYSYPQENTATDSTYLYIGTGYRHTICGYVWDFRIYPSALTLPEVNRLYQTGSIIDPAPPPVP